MEGATEIFLSTSASTRQDLRQPLLTLLDEIRTAVESAADAIAVQADLYFSLLEKDILA